MAQSSRLAPVELVPFLTAFDPSDLPGGSVDPMGFDRGYTLLADKLLPGLTNVANRPRYLSMLCAGASLIESAVERPPRDEQEARLQAVLTFERLWALANVRASRDSGEENLSSQGIRGVTFAADYLNELEHKKQERTAGGFRMLQRQVTTGAIGIYGNIAAGMRLWDRALLRPTADHGARLAEAFLKETKAPNILVKIVLGEGDISLQTLSQWGVSAHLRKLPSGAEAACLHEALHRDPIRSRMADLLESFPAQDGEDELHRLKRIHQQCRHDEAHLDLAEAIAAILPYEQCYRLTILGLERLLWLARTLPTGAISAKDIAEDSVFQGIVDALPKSFDSLRAACETGTHAFLPTDHQRLREILGFLQRAAASYSPGEFVEALLDQHRDVQHGKFDGGRRKMPWLERRNGLIGMTLTRVGGLGWEATQANEIRPHEYRTFSADAFLAAARERKP